MANHRAATRMVMAVNLRDWLLWLAAHYDPALQTPENRERRRLGALLEELGQRAGAIDTMGQTAGGSACLRSSFDWERGEIEFCHPALLTNRIGSPDPEALITRLVAVTGIPERLPEEPPEPEYVV